MHCPSSRPKRAANIPSITALRRQLDYGDSRLTRCSDFYDDVRVFRKKYRTHNNHYGFSLIDWNSSVHQAGLDEMVHAYLDGQKNGTLYWPDDEASPNLNKLRYSNDQDRHLIRQLMKQLLFRLNQQQYRNNKYKKGDNFDIEGIYGQKQRSFSSIESSEGLQKGQTEPPTQFLLDRPGIYGQTQHSFSSIEPSGGLQRGQTEQPTQLLLDRHIVLICRVILSRTPVYESKCLEAEGGFQEKSLKEFLQALPIEGSLTGVAFYLKGTRLNVEERIACDDEVRFDVMKRYFNRLIQSCLANQNDYRAPLILEVEIEPLRDEMNVMVADELPF